MSQIASVNTDIFVRMFGNIWFVDQKNKTIIQHPGRVPPAMFYGSFFNTLEEAKKHGPDGCRIKPLPVRIIIPQRTPAPLSSKVRSNSSIPRDIYIFEFDQIMEKGLKVVTAKIKEVEFEYPPALLAGKVDFVASAILAGDNSQYRIRVEYNEDINIGIYENPEIRIDSELRLFRTSKQRMAFFSLSEAQKEADVFARSLVKAADWRSRRE